MPRGISIFAHSSSRKIFVRIPRVANMPRMFKRKAIYSREKRHSPIVPLPTSNAVPSSNKLMFPSACGTFAGRQDQTDSYATRTAKHFQANANSFNRNASSFEPDPTAKRSALNTKPGWIVTL